MLLAGISLLLVVPSASAQSLEAPPGLFSNRPVRDPLRINWGSGSVDAAAVPALSLPAPPALLRQAASQPLHAAAIQHSDAYETRRKIHKYASFATLPLFATELVLGQSLYNSTGNADGTKGAHVVVGTAMTALFSVNTVTGVWNMFGTEGRREKEGRKLRLVHGLLMMAANVGFVATALAAPDNEGGEAGPRADDGRSTHRALAIYLDRDRHGRVSADALREPLTC